MACNVTSAFRTTSKKSLTRSSQDHFSVVAYSKRDNGLSTRLKLAAFSSKTYSTSWSNTFDHASYGVSVLRNQLTVCHHEICQLCCLYVRRRTCPKLDISDFKGQAEWKSCCCNGNLSTVWYQIGNPFLQVWPCCLFQLRGRLEVYVRRPS
jgi:hypothetical protein